MHRKIQSILSSLDRGRGQGISLFELEIRRALEFADGDRVLRQFLDDSYEIASCARIVFTNRPGWIDVLVVLSPAGDAAGRLREERMVITYDAQQGELIAVASCHRDFTKMGAESNRLPFALEIPSHATDVAASESDGNLVELTTRRALFAKALAAAIVPAVAFAGSASAASTTSDRRYNTNDQTASVTAKSSSEVTTPNDHDTQTDYPVDHHSDQHDDFHSYLQQD